MSKFIGMTGWIMKEHGILDSKLTIIEQDYEKKSSKGELYWKCRCECGNIVSLKGTRIRSGNTKSCGKCHTENLIGWKIWEHGVTDSRWKIIGRQPYNDKNGKSIWICQCLCGEIRNLDKYTLLTGMSKSCGCLRHELLVNFNMERGTPINEGQRFGKLIALQDLGLREYHGIMRRYTLCQCDCGSKPIAVLNTTLLQGGKKSCGCLISYGETYISKLLDINNINYKQQYSFDDLRSKNNIPLRFDFAIFDNNNNLSYLIEFDGKGHYTEPTGNWTNYSLEEIQARDQQKNEYCLLHNILLKRIPYTEGYNFTYTDIISNKYNVNNINNFSHL